MRFKCIKRTISFILLLSCIGSFNFVKPEVTKRDVGFFSLGAAIGISGVILARLLASSVAKEKQVEFNLIHEEEPQFLPQIIFHEKTLSDFVGQNNVILAVKEFLNEITFFEHYQRLGAKRIKALLVEGPSGNGKNLLVNAIAGELGCSLIPIDGYFFADNIPEVSEAKMRFMFDFAKRRSRDELTILFIDDIDLFAGMTQFYSVDLARRKLVNSLIKHIESIEDNENLVIIATSNSSSLDSNLFKPGCFDRNIHIPLPTFDGRAEIINYYLSDIALSENVSEETIRDLAEKTAGFNASLLKDITREAAIIAGKNYSNVVEEKHLERACKQQKLKKQTLFSKKEDESFYYTFSEKTRFYDVIGQEEPLIEIKEFIQFLKNSEQYTSLGARQPRGLLLHGPSGCGKTLIARAIAGEAGCCFISVSGSEFVKKYVGTGAGNVRAIFNFARKMSKEVPVIIFIDEIDGLGRRQGKDGSGANTEYNNTINEMLKQIDGFTSDENILIVGATNLIDELDPALLRPGRFDRKILIGLPKKEERKEILEYFLSKISIDPKMSSSDIAQEFSARTPGFSGAALENFVNEAAILAARNGNLFVYKERFEQALDKIALGLESKIECTKKQLERTAYHEAGHTLLAVLFDIPVEKVSILPRGRTLGVTWTNKKYEQGSYYTKSELVNEITCFYGGLVAEKLIFGQTTPGVSDDLEKGGQIAYNMINRFGMGTETLEGVPRIVVSKENSKKFDEETIKLLNNSYLKAKNLLTKHKDLLIEFSGQLLQKETMSKDEIYHVLGGIKGKCISDS